MKVREYVAVIQITAPPSTAFRAVSDPIWIAPNEMINAVLTMRALSGSLSLDESFDIALGKGSPPPHETDQ